MGGWEASHRRQPCVVQTRTPRPTSSCHSQLWLQQRLLCKAGRAGVAWVIFCEQGLMGVHAVDTNKWLHREFAHLRHGLRHHRK